MQNFSILAYIYQKLSLILTILLYESLWVFWYSWKNRKEKTEKTKKPECISFATLFKWKLWGIEILEKRLRRAFLEHLEIKHFIHNMRHSKTHYITYDLSGSVFS